MAVGSAVPFVATADHQDRTAELAVGSAVPFVATADHQDRIADWMSDQLFLLWQQLIIRTEQLIGCKISVYFVATADH